MGTIRRATVAALAAGTIAGLAGCGAGTSGNVAGPSVSPAGEAGGGSGAGSGSIQPSGQAGPMSPRGTAPAPVRACRTIALALKVDAGQASGAAGSTFYPIDFTNTSAADCVLDGYPGVSIVTAASRAGRQLGAAAQQNPAFAGIAVRIVPGGHAHAWLQVSGAGNYPKAACEPEPAGWLRVYPPGETEPRYVRLELTACAAPAAAQLTIVPVRASLGSHGSLP